MRKLLPAVLLAMTIWPATGLAADICLKSDRLDRITMTAPSQATATDLSGRRFEITFVGPCGARHLNVYFVTKPELLPPCLTPGTGLATNKEGSCVIASVKLQS